MGFLFDNRNVDARNLYDLLAPQRPKPEDPILKLQQRTQETLDAVAGQSESQRILLGNLLRARQESAEQNKANLQQQSQALGAAFKEILDAFMGFSSEAEDAAARARESTEQLNRSRIEFLRNPRTIRSVSSADVTDPSRSTTQPAIGSSRRAALTQPRNVFGVQQSR